MHIALETAPADTTIIREILSPWEINFTNLDESDIAIFYGSKVSEKNKCVIIPSTNRDFRSLNDSQKGTALNENNETKLVFQSKNGLWSELESPKLHDSNSGNIVLDTDIISDYTKSINNTLNAKLSMFYKTMTKLPIPYGLVPKNIRDSIMKSTCEYANFTLLDKLKVDSLRLILANAISELSGEQLRRKKWRGKQFACLMTHDIENRQCLERAVNIKKIEEKYDVCSSWFIPSKIYELSGETLGILKNFGEIGAHDTKHDGKLSRLSKSELTERLSEAKTTLAEISGASIDGFRAPLLQHNFQIIDALSSSGYAYDASIPCWEPKHPSTMKPHGIGTIFPFHVNGFCEVPLTLPQDHQMLHVLGMSAKQTVASWLSLMDEIKSMGGMCVFLTHPNELANFSNQDAYEELLNAITSDKSASIMLPKSIIDFFAA